MAELLSGLTKIVIPDSESLVVDGRATPELMAVLNNLARGFNQIRSLDVPEVSDIEPSQLADDFGTIILGWDSLVDTTKYSTTASIPNDDTKPEITEGDAAFSLAYTPKRSDSTIYIDALMRATNVNGTHTIALFMSTQTECLASFPASISDLVYIRAEVASWGTSSRTFSIRHGQSGGGTGYIGSYIGSTATYNNSMISTMNIIERKNTPIS